MQLSSGNTQTASRKTRKEQKIKIKKIITTMKGDDQKQNYKPSNIK